MQPNQSHILYCTSSFVKGKSHPGGRSTLNVLLGGCTPLADGQSSSVCPSTALSGGFCRLQGLIPPGV